MNIVASALKILNPGTPMNTATQEPSAPELDEAKLSKRLAEIEAAISAGEGDVLALLEEEESTKRALQAAGIARQKRTDEEYRAKLEARRAAWMRDRDEALSGLWRALPEARHFLHEVERLEQRMEEIGSGLIEEHTGLPFGAAGRMAQAIAEALAGSPLGEQCYASDEELRLLGLSREGVQPKPATSMLPPPPLVIDDPSLRRPPPTFSGAWSMATGQPIDD
jgi:hypothetical protein